MSVNEKYVVMKVGDSSLVEDAVVIRLKDPFASTALFTYASTILSFIEMMSDFGFLSEEDTERLVEIADYFHNQGVESAEIVGKRLPD
jgi:hypothetical protein